MNLLSLGQSSCEIEIEFEGEASRKTVDIKLDGQRREKLLLYKDGENVTGKLKLQPKIGKKVEHQGVRVQFIGAIETFHDNSNTFEFISVTQEVAYPGELRIQSMFGFEFRNVEKIYESYHGLNVNLRYFVRVTILRRMKDIVKERDVWVFAPSSSALISDHFPNKNIVMEVGIEDCLHIEFEYDKSRYHLQDVILGKVYFMLVRIKIKHMEISIIRRESIGAGANVFMENETVSKFEIMDGSPVKGESIPLRLFLNGFDLTPTFKDVCMKFSVKYFLNLVLLDEDDRRYFKQQEIVLWRQS